MHFKSHHSTWMPDTLVFSSQYCIITGVNVVILQGHCCGPRRSCRPAMCRDHFHLLPRSSWWLTDRARLSERQATLSETQPDTFSYQKGCRILGIKMCNTSRSKTPVEIIYLVRLVNDDGIIRECFHNVEIFNSGWGSEEFSQIVILELRKSNSVDMMVTSDILNSLSQSNRTAGSQK